MSKILIADDDRAIVTLLVEVFQRNGFTDLITCNTLESVHAAINEEKPDLVIMDVGGEVGLKYADELYARGQKVIVTSDSGVTNAPRVPKPEGIPRAIIEKTKELL